MLIKTVQLIEFIHTILTGIPKPQNIHVVIGKPIFVPHEENPSQESVEQYHAKFLEETENLYYRHRGENGYGNRNLRIV